jgi:hypothetical protein
MQAEKTPGRKQPRVKATTGGGGDDDSDSSD